MVFSTELAEKIEVSNGNKYLEAGIHDDVKLVSARAATSINGNKFLEIKFEKEGKELVHTEWEPTPNPTVSAEENQKKATNQVSRIMQILKCFYPKEALTFSGESYSEFINWVVNLLNAADKSKLVRLKVVYNSKGYTTLPNYAKFIFIEPMNLPEGQSSKISILGIDTIVKPTVIADKEAIEINPLESTNTTSSANDLPF